MKLLSSKRSKIMAVIGLGVLFLGLGFLGWQVKGGKLFSRADVLSGDPGSLPSAPQNLEVFYPSVADDVPQNFWAYKYIDAMAKTQPGYDGPIMGFVGSSDSSNWAPQESQTKERALVHVVKALKIPPCSDSICPLRFSDVPSTSWSAPYIRAADKAGLLKCNAMTGTTWCPVATSIFNPTQSGGATSDPLRALFITTLLYNAGKPYAYPTGAAYNNASPLTRAITAAILASNLNLPGDLPKPNILLRFQYPESEATGFDLGFEVYRKKAFESESTLLFSQAPPEEGMVEGSDFGLFYDTSLEWNTSYYYDVYLINRDGEYSTAAEKDLTTLEAPK